ncbi:hypothetical protein RJ639_036276 [Escallonia herrerae]|uniref:Pentatricopeptide repeat-containing protein n=1 Tax=Escallonia herrerae TaxID=1293975 RepID=A0AA88WR68_9ASTE|nr:hypothetical protein RJ639_036276 [Escallonia herrerae]
MKRLEIVINLFEACNNGNSVTQLHAVLTKTGCFVDDFFATKLNVLYAKYASPKAARKLFDEIPQRTTYIWNAILRCYCREKHYQETISLFSNMVSAEQPDHITLTIALKACSRLQALEFGKMIHGSIKKNDKFDPNMYVGSALIDLYSKCGLVGDALRVFEEYSRPDVVLWTTIITGYEQNGYPVEALLIFTRMVVTGHVSPDPVTLVSVVSACVQLLDLKAGRSVHGYVTRKGFDCGLSLKKNALIRKSMCQSVFPGRFLLRNIVASRFYLIIGHDILFTTLEFGDERSVAA